MPHLLGHAEGMVSVGLPRKVAYVEVQVARDLTVSSLRPLPPTSQMGELRLLEGRDSPTSPRKVSCPQAG